MAMAGGMGMMGPGGMVMMPGMVAPGMMGEAAARPARWGVPEGATRRNTYAHHLVLLTSRAAASRMLCSARMLEAA